jgi:hypothetical protein
MQTVSDEQREQIEREYRELLRAAVALDSEQPSDIRDRYMNSERNGQ